MSLDARWRVLLPLLLAPASVAAQDTVKTKSFVGDAGFVNVAGNTRLSTLNVGDKFTANTRGKTVIFTQVFGMVYGSTEGTKTVENYRASLRLDYKLSGRLYTYGLVGWDRNTFGGVERRFEESIGLAYLAVDRPRDHLDFEVGLSLFQQRNTVAAAGTFDDNFKAGRLAGFYKHTFTKNAIFTQSAEFIPNFDDSDDWRLNTETAVVAPISTRVGLKLGYVIRYDHLPSFKPAPNPNNERFERSDRFLTAGISISY